MLSNLILARIREVYPAFEREGVAQVCDWIIGRIGENESLGLLDNGIVFSPSEIIQAIGWSEDKSKTQDVLRGLDFLSFGPVQLLKREFEFWPLDDEDARPVAISLDELAEAAEKGGLVCPRTNQFIENFKAQVSVAYYTDSATLRKAEEMADER